jgi:hypothetical protein
MSTSAAPETGPLTFTLINHVPAFAELLSAPTFGIMVFAFIDPDFIL